MKTHFILILLALVFLTACKQENQPVKETKKNNKENQTKPDSTVNKEATEKKLKRLTEDEKELLAKKVRKDSRIKKLESRQNEKQDFAERDLQQAERY